MDEETIAQAWLSGRWSPLEISDTTIEVVYPGRRQRTSGPDFVDAIINIAGRRLTGAVEVHVNASSWHTHRHHLDPAYNDTILHVVMRSDSALPVVTAGGKTVAQVRLPLTILTSHIPSKPIATPCRRGNNAINAVEEACMMRFEMKTRHFTNDLRLQPPNEVVYRGIAVALGYQENRTPMRVLAEAMTLANIENSGLDQRPLLLEAMILQNAGLLDESAAKTDTEARRLWHLLTGKTNMPTLNRSHWCFTRSRPANSPARRLAALARLIQRHSARQLDTNLLEPLRRGQPAVTTVRLLEENLIIAVHSYWADHSDFGRLLPRPCSLLGTQRASAIAANVILPFANALGQTTGDTRLINTAIDAYHAYPAHGGNEITRYMSQMLALPVKTVCREQGLIHIYRNWCQEKQCEACPASSVKLKAQIPKF